MSERDTHFAGFASAVMRKMGREAMRPEHDWTGETGIASLEEIIAQCAYDLVYHTLSHTTEAMAANCEHETEIPENVQYIPDMPVLP